MTRLIANYSAALAMLIACSQPLSAQVDAGTITGIVSDSPVQSCLVPPSS